MKEKFHSPKQTIRMLQQLAMASAVILTVLTGYSTDAGNITAKNLGNKPAVIWEHTEWSLENVSHSGNAFDVVATVTFTHLASGQKHSTEMFYDGNKTWKFRFTATDTGRWSFITKSDNPDLDGYSGTVTVNANPNPRAAGFITNYGNKWARLGTGEVFVPQLVMYCSPTEYYNRPDKIDADIRTFLVEHGFTGFHTYVSCRWFDIDHDRSDNINSQDPNPDPRTFEALELLITKVYAVGGTVHIWVWGDEQRRMTPIRWGINGAADRRLQRYIAARLGPIPGWTMGYGFDLWEWVKPEQLTAWHEYMHAHFGWPHLLGARSQKRRLTQLSEAMDYSSYEQHRPDYAGYVETIEQGPLKPSFSEDRFRIRKNVYPDKDYDFDMTRRGLWHSAMAGGVANIWGNRLNHRPDGMSHHYPNKHQILTWSRFWKNRFKKEMVRDNRLTDSLCLKVPGRLAVFYKENSNSITMDLREMPEPQPAIAVDTKKEYEEINLDLLDCKIQKWRAPYSSDWAIAVGSFGDTTTNQK